MDLIFSFHAQALLRSARELGHPDSNREHGKRQHVRLAGSIGLDVFRRVSDTMLTFLSRKN